MTRLPLAASALLALSFAADAKDVDRVFWARAFTGLESYARPAVMQGLAAAGRPRTWSGCVHRGRSPVNAWRSPLRDTAGAFAAPDL